MLGLSRTVVGGKTTEFEFLRIAVVDGALAYVAKASGQAEAAFPVKSIEDGVVVFENLSHDFPQRIIYLPQRRTLPSPRASKASSRARREAATFRTSAAQADRSSSGCSRPRTLVSSSPARRRSLP